MPSRFAPAKINLALHVTGQQPNGFHQLDSLVCFASVGDELSVRMATDMSLEISGPMAADVPGGPDNLILQAAGMFGTDQGARIALRKHLPVASGIGGGSADAAACLHLLAEIWELDLPAAADLLAFGADVPVCLDGRSARMRGIGEKIEPVLDMPNFQAVLVNPGCALATKAVFAALPEKTNPPLEQLPVSTDPAEWLEFLAAQRNDLQIPAQRLAPEIGQVLAALNLSKDCNLARMSGSGATCFGLFETAEMAQAAALEIRNQQPDWWVTACQLAD